MSDFGNYSQIKIRKDHKCVYCERTIPKGTSCFNYRGLWQGDWQNWYSCEFCEIHVDPISNEPISGDEFINWLTSSSHFKCPNCEKHTSNHNFKWSKNCTAVDVQCTQCQFEWVVEIPFEVESREL